MILTLLLLYSAQSLGTCKRAEAFRSLSRSCSCSEAKVSVSIVLQGEVRERVQMRLQKPIAKSDHEGWIRLLT